MTLQELGWIDFGSVTRTITAHFRSGQTQLRIDEPGGAVVVDLMHLNAAEVDLPRAEIEGRLRPGLIAAPRMPFRLKVSAEAARAAIEKTDSGPFVGHDPRETAGLWDVTLFSSDASKLAWLSGAHSLEDLRTQFIPAIRDLAGLYRSRERRFGEPMVEGLAAFYTTSSRTFPVRAVLWRAKLAVMLEEKDSPEILREVYAAVAT